MSKIKAKKKRPFDEKAHIYSHEEMLKEANKRAEKIAEEMAVSMYVNMIRKEVLEVSFTILKLCCIVLNDIFHFGGSRLRTFQDEVFTRFSDYREKKYKLGDINEIYDSLMGKYKIEDDPFNMK